MSMVALIDYGSGNIHSAHKALAAVSDHAVKLTDDPAVIADADYVVLPGVGAFGQCAENLKFRPGVWDALHEVAIEKQRPFLGICVGMQLLAETGLERGTHQGLGWLPGEVRRLKAGAGNRVPHMGWNRTKAVQENPLLDEAADFYFVHSYVMDTDEKYVIARCDYGESFPAMVQKDNIVGTQCHPEKSQAAGLALLRKFLAL